MMQLKSKHRIMITFILLLFPFINACESTNESGGAESATASYTAGTYTVESDEGYGDPIEIEVTFSDTEITGIEILNHSETDNIGGAALENLSEEIVGSQTLAVDVVSGATRSSQALLSAVEEAVMEADGDVELLQTEVEDDGEQVVENLEADVVVIGGGASGTSAAISAGDSGANVILIEKTGTIGGASNLSWAGKSYNSSAAEEADSEEIDIEEEISEWVEDNAWRVDASVIRQYVTESGETFEWLEEKGYVTEYMDLGGEQMHALPPYEEREDLLRTMLEESVEGNGGQVITETTAQELLSDEEGNIIGVVAEQSDGTILEIDAESVILATGGYAANSEMVKEHFGFEGINGGLGQNVGEGLAMAWEAGARIPDNMGGQMLHQTLARATDNLQSNYSPFEAVYPMMTTYLPNFMNVGASGARFRDETATLEAVAAANTSAFHGPFHYVIVSQEQLIALESEGMQGVGAPATPGMPPEFTGEIADQFTLEEPWENATEVFEAMVENGDGFKGETIEELAENAGMDVDLFVETFENYQQAIESGVDEEFGKTEEFLAPMGEGPYYAVTAEINNLGSIGGLLINREFQVLNNERVPMNGLYAVGVEAAGVLYNDTYIGNGVGIGYAFTSGRLGGEYAAESALEE